MRDLKTGLEDASAALTSLRIPFALVGGLAVSVRAEPRFTAGLDFAVVADDDAVLEGWASRLLHRGYSVVAVIEQDAVERLATLRLRSPKGIALDLLSASSGIEAEVVAAAEKVNVLGTVLPVATTEALVALKVLSADDSRPKDLEDLRGLIDQRPDPATVIRLLSLIEERGYAREQDLQQKWADLRVRMA